MKSENIKNYVPFLVILTSITIIATRPNSLVANSAFLFAGIAVVAAGTFLGRYTKLTYKPYIILLISALIALIVSSISFFAAEQPECQDYVVLCVSSEFIWSLIVLIISALAAGYILGFFLPGVAIGKKLKQKRKKNTGQ